MRTLEEVERAFAVGWGDVPETYETRKLRDEFDSFANALWHNLPNGPEKTLVLRSLWRTQSEAQLSLCISAAPAEE